MVSLSVPNNPATPSEGLRPVNLRTDLAPLADLIELAFSDSMDSSGRAAVREMRALSRFGAGLNLLAGVNDLTQGISLGYVWMVDGRLVGNVSLYSASWPASLGTAWIIANVAVHPDYRRRGIARHLMIASMETIRQRGGTTAILQVDQHNVAARRLYESLGFAADGEWTHWRRPASTRIPPPLSGTPFDITRRRRGEWRAEFELAQRVRPPGSGGLGWLRPLHVGLFRDDLGTIIRDWINLRSRERLIIRSDDGRRVVAAMRIESAFASSSVQLTLLTEPHGAGLYAEALLNLAVRRFGTRQPLTSDHPADDTAVGEVFQHFQFRPQRTLVHMRWDVPRE